MTDLYLGFYLSAYLFNDTCPLLRLMSERVFSPSVSYSKNLSENFLLSRITLWPCEVKLILSFDATIHIKIVC